jgi:hypothetical protein
MPTNDVASFRLRPIGVLATFVELTLAVGLPRPMMVGSPGGVPIPGSSPGGDGAMFGNFSVGSPEVGGRVLRVGSPLRAVLRVVLRVGSQLNPVACEPALLGLVT